MNVLICFSLLVACASAQYYGYSGYYAPYAPYSAHQYHSQDELGQASFGYSYPGQASTTYRDAFGNQVGSYAYINADGKEVRVSFVADSNGFRVVSNDLPQAPVDNLVAPVNDLVAPVFTGQAPEPVQDTPEVVEAKTAFFKLYKEAADAAAAAPESRKKRNVVAYTLPVAAPVALPAYAKSTIKTAFYEPNEAALTPASTTKIDLKEKDQEILTPLAYSYPAYPHVAPLAAPLAATKLVAAPYYGYHTIF